MTTLQDLGSRGRVVLDLRDAVNAGLICGPRILASGPPITISGGHMHYLGGEADTADEVRRIARSHWRMGADVFKMVLNGGGTPRTHPWIPAYSQPEIDAGRRRGSRSRNSVDCACELIRSHSPRGHGWGERSRTLYLPSRPGRCPLRRSACRRDCASRCVRRAHSASGVSEPSTSA